jgi:hypothetical protein
MHAENDASAMRAENGDVGALRRRRRQVGPIVAFAIDRFPFAVRGSGPTLEPDPAERSCNRDGTAVQRGEPRDYFPISSTPIVKEPPPL